MRKAAKAAIDMEGLYNSKAVVSRQCPQEEFKQNNSLSQHRSLPAALARPGALAATATAALT